MSVDPFDLTGLTIYNDYLTHRQCKKCTHRANRLMAYGTRDSEMPPRAELFSDWQDLPIVTNYAGRADIKKALNAPFCLT
jgi:hypothetical protein